MNGIAEGKKVFLLLESRFREGNLYTSQNNFQSWVKIPHLDNMTLSLSVSSGRKPPRKMKWIHYKKSTFYEKAYHHLDIHYNIVTIIISIKTYLSKWPRNLGVILRRPSLLTVSICLDGLNEKKTQIMSTIVQIDQ